jgi:NADPH-dependent 2,4-dienoyl-CoA reductase/sulfur reductase-like enzyme
MTFPPPSPSGPPPLSRYDVAVVGAGPAGLAAATTAARTGCRVALLDAQPAVGGQYWRGADPGVQLSGVDVLTGSAVWFVGAPGFTLHRHGGGAVTADQLIFATGAHDRPLPFPGWDLPGVVTPGGAQALLKGAGVPIGNRVVIAGAGPFLLPVATALLAAGVEVAGVYEAGDPTRYARSFGAVAGARGKAREAAGYLTTLARHRVPYRVRHAVVAARGVASVSSVDVGRLDRAGGLVPGSVRRVECDALAVGYGFTPQLELPLALGCATRLDVDGSLVLAVDVAGRTSVPEVYAAGEVTGVGGADLAQVEGRLVGASAARSAGHPSPLSEIELTRLLARRSALRRFAALMHKVHAPPTGWPAWLAEDTVVCRCEDVPVHRIRAAVNDLGATDGRTVKSLCRPGMGWCQGRVCGYPVAELTARWCARPPTAGDLAAFAHRPIAHPVRLGDLAQGS